MNKNRENEKIMFNNVNIKTRGLKSKSKSQKQLKFKAFNAKNIQKSKSYSK